MPSSSRPDFIELKTRERSFKPSERRLVGHTPTIALTPVADGRAGAYEGNLTDTWRMVEKVYDLITKNVSLPDGTPPRVVVAPEIVYGARSGARAQEYYASQGVSANIWISRSWAYSDELMSACAGVGSSEWVQAAYGLNQTNRPGAVWLKAFCAAMDEKGKPIFSIYNPDLEDEKGPLAPYVTERILRFARCVTTVAEMRGKNYLSVGSVSMGIIGSDVRRNTMAQYLGMGTVSVDMVAVRGRIDNGFYDHEELERAFRFMKRSFKYKFNTGKKPYTDDNLLKECIKMTMIVRDLMRGNPRLADPAVGKKQGFKADVEHSQGHNAIAAGTQGQRAWTDLYPNFDLPESMLNASFDWDGFRVPYIIATENDAKNGVGMLVAHLLTGGLAQLFADIRTNWTASSVKKATGVDVSKIVPQGFIDKRNSGAGALDYALDILSLAGVKSTADIQAVSRKLRSDKGLQKKLMDKAMAGTTYMGAILEYFLGDGLSSSFRTPGGVPMTAYRYNMVENMLTCSVVEGKTVELPQKVAKHVGEVTDKTWPETFWVPRGMSSFEYMSRIGPNHDAQLFRSYWRRYDHVERHAAHTSRHAQCGQGGHLQTYYVGPLRRGRLPCLWQAWPIVHMSFRSQGNRASRKIPHGGLGARLNIFMSKVSVQFVVYNEERQVERSVRSVLADQCPELEVLVFDNGSTDSTQEILQRLRDCDRRVRIEGSERRLGFGKARAKVISMTDAEFVAPFDTGSLFLPGRIQRQISALERNPDIAGVYGKAKKVKADGKELGVSMGCSFSSFYLPFMNPVCPGTAMFRRSAILEAGSYVDVGSSLEDYFLLLRIAQKWSLLFENEFRSLVCSPEKQPAASEGSRGKGVERMESARKFVLKANHDLVGELTSEETLSFSQSDIPRIMLVLGLLAHSLEPASAECQKILKVAEHIEPDDYGVLIQKHLRYAKAGDVSDALLQCDLIRFRYPHDHFLCMTACEYMLTLLRQIPDTPKEKIAQAAAMFDKHSHSFHAAPTGIDK